MNKINYIYLFGGVVALIFGILYIKYLNKDSKKHLKNSVFEKSLNFEGYLGGVASLIGGLVMIIGEIKKLF
jgi:hypothetical protein